MNAIAFSPDDRRGATAGADRRINVWDVTSDPQHRVLKGHSNPIMVLSISRDDRRFAATGYPYSSGTPNSNDLIVIDLNTGQQLTTLRGHSRGINAAGLQNLKNSKHYRKELRLLSMLRTHRISR